MMEVTVRKLLASEVDEAVKVEEDAMKGYGYLRDVADLFFSDEIGAMLGAFYNDELVGIAKYTVLPDHTAWLETLRVKQKYQRQGVGRSLYEEFERLSKELGVKSMAMYTGLTNIPSASLARVFGLDTSGRYKEFQLDLKDLQSTDTSKFDIASEEEGYKLLSTLKEKYENYIIFNRTFMLMNEANLKAISNEGKVLVDNSDGTFMAFGNRFLEKRSVQIAMMSGDYKKCIDYAIKIGLEKNVPQVVTEAPYDDEELHEILKSYGFHEAGNLQVMSGDVR